MTNQQEQNAFGSISQLNKIVNFLVKNNYIAYHQYQPNSTIFNYIINGSNNNLL